MADVFKMVTLRDPVTGDYLVPRTWGTIGYQIIDGEIVPPIYISDPVFCITGSYTGNDSTGSSVKREINVGHTVKAVLILSGGVNTNTSYNGVCGGLATIESPLQVLCNQGDIESGQTNVDLISMKDKSFYVCNYKNSVGANTTVGGVNLTKLNYTYIAFVEK